jgi:hypothetical protein
LNSHVKLVGSAGDAALLGNHPKIIEMFVIEWRTHAQFFQEYK